MIPMMFFIWRHTRKDHIVVVNSHSYSCKTCRRAEPR